MRTRQGRLSVLLSVIDGRERGRLYRCQNSCHPTRCDEWERTQDRSESQGGAISPNPARESCRVPARDVLDPRQVVMSDAWGRIVRSVNWPEAGLPAMNLDLHGIAPGIYFLQLLGREKKATYKLIKH
jgi:hypothetical protein